MNAPSKMLGSTLRHAQGWRRARRYGYQTGGLEVSQLAIGLLVVLALLFRF